MLLFSSKLIKVVSVERNSEATTLTRLVVMAVLLQSGFCDCKHICFHHQDDPPVSDEDENKETRTDDIPVWDQRFLKVDQGTLFELALVNVNLCCSTENNRG